MSGLNLSRKTSESLFLAVATKKPETVSCPSADGAWSLHPKVQQRALDPRIQGRRACFHTNSPELL
jgi:hypothetical protein